ncbi:MAG: hypothetical protein WCR78_00055 [Arcobacteraceae bacterium]
MKMLKLLLQELLFFSWYTFFSNGSNCNTWIKIKISHYAMPIIIFGIFFRFSKEQKNKGLCNILLGLGFIFLGISYMVNGFSSLKDSIDLSVYALDGFF